MEYMKYDILCGCCLIGFCKIPILEDLHVSMFREILQLDSLTKRFIGYWICTYGIIRLHLGLYIVQNITNEIPDVITNVIAMTYAIEAVVFTNELWRHCNMKIERTCMVIGMCVLITFSLV